jgi:hypothetical protein
MAENGKAKAPVEPTARVVLKRERVLVLPPELDGEALGKTLVDVAKAVGVRAGSLKPVDAWVPVAEATGSKTHAVEAYAGKAGTAEALPGVYKAPNLSSWRGGEVYEAPPQPLVERKPLVDEALS